MKRIVLAAGLLTALLAGAGAGCMQTAGAQAQDRSTTGQGAAGARGALSAEERGRIVDIIKKQGFREATKAKFPLVVGAAVPLSETLFPLPAGVTEMRPEWRGSNFLVIEKKVVIVDPLELKVRAIIEQ